MILNLVLSFINVSPESVSQSVDRDCRAISFVTKGPVESALSMRPYDFRREGF
jgi:hypothetical protein